MGELIQFPQNDERQWSQYELIIREYMKSSGVSLDMENYLCERLKNFFISTLNEEFRIDFQIPPGLHLNEAQQTLLMDHLHETLDSFSQQLYEYMSRILVERLIFEMEIYYGGE